MCVNCDRNHKCWSKLWFGLLIGCLVNAVHVSIEICFTWSGYLQVGIQIQSQGCFSTTLDHELAHWSRKILRGLGNAAAHRFKSGGQTQFKENRQYLPFASNVQQCNGWRVFIWRTQVLAFGGGAFHDACADKARYVRVQPRSRNVAPSIVIWRGYIVGHCIRICSPTLRTLCKYFFASLSTSDICVRIPPDIMSLFWWSVLGASKYFVQEPERKRRLWNT